MTITLRLDKGSELTHGELDGNFEDLVVRTTSITPGTFNPSGIDLSQPGQTHYQPFAQSGDITLALSGAAHVPGASASVRITGNGSNITPSGNVVWADNNGQEARTLSSTALLQVAYIDDYAGSGAPRAVVAIAAAGGGGGGGGGISAVVEDTTPQLGGDLDAQGNVIYGNRVGVENASGTLDDTHCGKRLLTTGSCTLPASVGWWATIELGGDHDLTFAGVGTLDVSARGWEAGDIIGVTVLSTTTLDISRVSNTAKVTESAFV